MHDLMAQGLGLDVALFIDPFGHLVDLVGVRPGHIDHYWRIDFRTVVQSDAQNLVVFTAYGSDFGVEDELGPFGFGSPHDVVGGKCGIAHVAAFGAVNTAFQHLFGFVEKIRVFRTFYRPELVQVVNRDHLLDLFHTPLFVFDAHSVIIALDFAPVVSLGF